MADTVPVLLAAAGPGPAQIRQNASQQDTLCHLYLTGAGHDQRFLLYSSS